MTSAEEKGDYVLRISGKDKDGNLISMELDAQTGVARLFDKDGMLIGEELLGAGQKARWFTQDRFAEKYYSISPYTYVTNNPVIFTDPTGDTINVSAILASDQTNGTNYMGIIISDLNAQTGLTFSVNDKSQLTYAIDSNGKTVVATDENGNQLGSATARDLMTNAVGHTETARAFLTIDRGSQGVVGGLAFGIDPTQIDKFIAGASGVDGKTQGYGMTFMHEMSHTVIGGSLRDSPYRDANPGPVENRMNQIRGELNAQGQNYGQRMTYPATYIMGAASHVIPFNHTSLSVMRLGMNPRPSSNTAIVRDQYIRF